jgi:plasmid stabilization system protein ParE
MTFGYRLISETDQLPTFPEMGRIVPEYNNPIIREVIVRPYRIIYRVNHERELCEIARVWHSARGTPVL